MRRSSSGAGKTLAAAAEARATGAVTAVGSGVTSGLFSSAACSDRPARICVADRGSSRVWKNTQAGGVVAASRRAAVTGKRAGAKRCAAIPASAFCELPGRAKTAIGTVRKMSCQRRQYGNCARLSPPISQTNRRPREAPAQRPQRVGGVGRCRAAPRCRVTRMRRSAAATAVRLAQALLERRHAGRGLQRVLRRHQPPDLVELEPAPAPAG